MTETEPTTLTLSDGRVATVRGRDPAADRRCNVYLLQAGFYRGGGQINSVEMATAMAVFSIIAIDGAPVPWPPVPPRRAAVRAYLRRFADGDIEALAGLYNTLNPTLTPLLHLGRPGQRHGHGHGGHR